MKLYTAEALYSALQQTPGQEARSGQTDSLEAVHVMTSKKPNAKVLRLLGTAMTLSLVNTRVLRLLRTAICPPTVNVRVLKQPGLAKKSHHLHIAAVAWGTPLLLLPWEEAGVQHCVRLREIALGVVHEEKA